MSADIANAQEKAPATAPHPRLSDRLSAADYNTRFAAASGGTKETVQLSTSLRPAIGLIVKMVGDGSPAYELGLREGDLLARINGHVLWNSDSLGFEQRRSLEFYSIASKKKKTIKLPPGNIGIATNEYWRPEWTYLRGKSANSKWNTEAIVGVTMASVDPDLAETAWNHAVQKGYQPDQYSAASMLEIALARGDSQLASEAGAYLRRFESDNSGVVNPVLLYRVALAFGRLDEMRRVVEKNPGIFPIDVAHIQYLTDLQAANPPVKGESLDALAKTYLRDNQIPRLMGYWNNDLVSGLPALQQGQPVKLNADPATRDALLVSPAEPTPNVDIKFTFSWEPRHEGDERFSPSVEVALVDNSHLSFGFLSSGDPRPALVGYSLTQLSGSIDELGTRTLDTKAIFKHSPMESAFRYVDPSVKWGPQKKYAVRVLKIGGQVEFELDGRKLISLPIDPSINQLMLRVKTVSSRVTIQDFHFDELIEDATK